MGSRRCLLSRNQEQHPPPQPSLFCRKFPSRRVCTVSTSLVLFISQSVKLIRVVSSTIGAGDTFIAGMLYSLIWRDNEWDIERKLGFANRVAGMKVAQDGFGDLSRALDGY